MTSGMNYSSIKIAHQVREFEEKRSQERKRNLLCLIHQYLLDEGYHLTAETFENETHIAKQLTVCDNIDLSTVLQEYETYYFLRFQKYPKICKKSIAAGSPLVEKRSKPLRKQNLETANNSSAQDDSSQGSVAKAALTSSLRGKPGAANLSRAKSNVAATSCCNLLDITVTPLLATAQSLGPEREEINCPDDSQQLPKPFSACYTTLGAEWREYVNLISKEIFVQNTDVGWDDVKGLETAKTLLKEAVVYPTKYPEIFKNILTPWRGLLLFGPPGTGKTLLAKAVAKESRSTFFNISASSIVSKWRGESEKLVRVLFEVARQQAPSTIFFDELDCVASKSDTTEHEASRRLKSELLVQLDGLANSDDRVFLLATSNVPWDLDPAMLRRLEKRILVDLPSVEAKESMIRHHLPPKINEKSNSELKCELDYNYLAQEMEGYSGSDVRLVCKEAAMCTMRKAFTALETTKKSSELETLDLDILTNADVLKAMVRTKPSTCHSLLDRYRVWQKEFGSA